MFEAIKNIADNFQPITLQWLFRRLFLDNEFTDLILKLNTQSQLYDQGVNSEGIRLDKIGGGYAPYTIMIKEMKGQPTDRVTLKDTGDFYESFRCKWLTEGNGAIEITANPMKDSTNLLDEWGKEILGLDEQSLVQLRSMAQTKITEIIKQQLKQAA